jgi:hypothetical protein
MKGRVGVTGVSMWTNTVLAAYSFPGMNIAAMSKDWFTSHVLASEIDALPQNQGKGI